MTQPLQQAYRHLQQCFAIIFILLFTGCASLQSTHINTDPEHQANLLDLLEKANTAYSEKKWGNAEEFYRSITATMTKDEFSFFRLGNSLLWQGRLEEAVTSLKRAVTLNPGFNEARHNLATAYILLSEAQMAALSSSASDEQKKNIEAKRTYLTKAAATEL